MVRPECYQCAACGKPWVDFYPGLTCQCGASVLRRRMVDVFAGAPGVRAAFLAGSAGPGPWSPYPLGNGCEGVAHG